MLFGKGVPPIPDKRKATAPLAQPPEKPRTQNHTRDVYNIFRFAARPQSAVAWSSGVVGFDDGSAPVVLGNCGARPKPKRGPEGWDVAAGGVLPHRKQHPALTPEQRGCQIGTPLAVRGPIASGRLRSIESRRHAEGGNDHRLYAGAGRPLPSSSRPHQSIEVG